jgi:hypothetical protein
MKNSAAVIRTKKLEEVRFRFKQLRSDLFFDRFVTTVNNDQNSRQRNSLQVVYTNQHIGKEYSFPGISYRGNKGC